MDELDKYYESMRWPGWQEELRVLEGNQVFSFYPFLSTEDTLIAERSRKPVNIAEIYDLHVGRQGGIIERSE